MRIVTLFLIGLALVSSNLRAEGESRFGGGANYWIAIDDLESDLDENGFSYYLSYQRMSSGPLGFQLDFEVLPDRFGKDAYAPAAYLLLGDAIYAAAGAGIVHTDGNWADDPFFALKAGLNLKLFKGLNLDVYGSYRFDSETDFDDAVDAIDTDTVFLGAAIRLTL
jgi:hypothetical protein